MQVKTPADMAIKEMAAEMISATKAFIVRALKPLEEKLNALELRAPVPGVKGDPGKDGASVDFSAIVDAVVQRIPVSKDGRDGKDGFGRDGKDGVSVDFDAVVDAVAKRFIAPRDGRDGSDGKDAQPIDEAKIIAEVLKSIHAPKDGRDGIDGKSITIEDVKPLLEAEVARWEAYFERRANDKLQKAIDRMPAPRDGTDGNDGANGKDAPPVDEGKIIAAVLKQIPPAKDGLSGKDAEPVDYDAIMEKVEKLMPVPKDGRDGKDGCNGQSITIDDVLPVLESELSKWALDFERRASGVLERAVERMPRPRDGADGKDGRDAFEVDSLGFVTKDEGRTLVIKLGAGEHQKVVEQRLDIPLYRGVFNPSLQYLKSDAVTYGGSMWMAMQDQPGTPGDGKTWKLAVKKGNDGKDAK